MKKGKLLVLICIVSILINIYQFYRIKKYNIEEKFYTQAVESDFKSFIIGLDYYDGKTTQISNQSAIKNSVSTISSIRCKSLLSAYRNNKQLSVMLLYLDMFFVMESNEFIDQNIEDIKPQLVQISKNLNDENTINELNLILKKWVLNISKSE
jgi:hypothetical protein